MCLFRVFTDLNNGGIRLIVIEKIHNTKIISMKVNALSLFMFDFKTVFTFSFITFNTN